VFANLREEIKHEILGVVLVTLAVLVYVGLASPSGSGSGELTRRVLSELFGEAQFFVPALFGLAGLMFLFQKGRLLTGARSTGWVLGLLAVLGWLHRLNLSNGGSEFRDIRYGWGGGILGAAVTWSLRQLFGPPGRDVALAALTVIAFLLATDLSLVRVLRGLGLTAVRLGRGLFRAAVRLVAPAPVRGGLGRAGREGGDEEDRSGSRASRSRGSPAPGPGWSAAPGGPTAVPGGLYAPREGSVGRRETGTAPPGVQGRTGPGLEGTAAGPGASVGRPGSAGPKGEQARRPRAGGRPYEQIALTEDVLYELPPLDLLDPPNPAKTRKARQDIEEKARVLEETLASFGVGGKVVGARRGPVVTRFEFQPAPGVKVARITSLADDIALHLAAEGVRIEAPIPGKHAVGIEVPNLEVSTVPLREVLEDPEVAASSSKLTVVFGKDIAGRPITGDLDRLLHVLIAGATGSGKSVCINAMLASLLFRAKPSEVKLLLIDPKVVELSVYEGIPHLVAPVVTDPRKAAGCLRWAVKQMEERYELFAAAGVRDISRYNALVSETAATGAGAGSEGTPSGSGPPTPWVRDPRSPTITVAGTALPRAEAGELGRDVRGPAGPQPLPYIVIVIDELADLMMVAPVDVEDAIWRLAQMARAAGIHLVVATQRPSVDVITGTIKANIPTRIAFAVSSQVDSRTIIDVAGAEKLLGHGDMLYMPVGTTKPIRVQGAYVSDREIEALVRYVKSQGRPRYAPDVLSQEEGPGEDEADADDSLFEDAVKVVMETGQASISMLQRKLRVGYTRAGRLIDMMEERGIVGPFEGSKAREILMSYDQYRRAREAAKRAVRPREDADAEGGARSGSVPSLSGAPENPRLRLGSAGELRRPSSPGAGSGEERGE